MQETKPDRKHYEQVLEEHRELRETMAGLREFCDKPRPGVESEEAPEWASELAQRLVEFHDRIYRHFHEEDASGFLEDICRSFPRASRTVDELRDDHRRLLRDLRSVLDETMVYAENRPPEHPNLRQRTLSLLTELERHEHEESDLMQRLLTEDLGSGD